jgi:flagellar basal-body rod modification protein FlgD
MAEINPILGANNQNAVYSTTQSSAQKTNISMNDFLLLVVAQMQNMDMNSAPDNGQFMTQMAQMASMQAMQELTAAYMSTMSVSYMGKYVKAEAVTNTGERAAAEGFVDRVNFNGGDAMVLVDNIWFRVQDIYELSVSAPEKPEATEFDYLDDVFADIDDVNTNINTNAGTNNNINPVNNTTALNISDYATDIDNDSTPAIG